MKRIATSAYSYLLLSRFILSVSVGFSGLVGFVKNIHGLTSQAWYIFLGVSLLSGGASALNQIQERYYDARMTRTMKRPIPAGMATVNEAGIFSAVLIILGLFFLFYHGNLNSFFVGIFSIVWYNFFYTYLKRTTAFAVFVGIFTGICPVFIGWLAAGGGWFDTDCLLIAVFMSAWQIPHFLLLMLRYEDDYRNARFPLLTDKYSVNYIKKLILISALLFLPIVLLLLHFNTINSILMQLSVVIITILLFVKLFYKLVGIVSNYKRLLMVVNIYMMIIMMMIFADRLLFP